MKIIIITGVFILISLASFSQKQILLSPNQKIKVALFNRQSADEGQWFLELSYSHQGKFSPVIQQIDLGLVRSDQDFTKNLKFLKASKVLTINETYSMVQS